MIIRATYCARPLNYSALENRVSRTQDFMAMAFKKEDRRRAVSSAERGVDQ